MAPDLACPTGPVRYPRRSSITEYRKSNKFLLNSMLLSLDEELQTAWVAALATAATARDAAGGESPGMETVANASLRDYAEAED